MKQRLFKRGEDIPQWVLKTTPLNEKGVSKFGVDMELVINNKGYVFYPVDIIDVKKEVIMTIECMYIHKMSKQIYVFSKPKKRVKKREKRKLYNKKGGWEIYETKTI